MITLQTMINVF